MQSLSQCAAKYRQDQPSDNFCTTAISVKNVSSTSIQNTTDITHSQLFLVLFLSREIIMLLLDKCFKLKSINLEDLANITLPLSNVHEDFVLNLHVYNRYKLLLRK